MEFAWSFQVGPFALKATRQTKTYCCHILTADEILGKTLHNWLKEQNYKLKKVPDSTTVTVSIPHHKHKSHISPIRRAMAELAIHNRITISVKDAEHGQP